MKTTVRIPGIHCASCAALIKDVSSEFRSIQSIDVDLDQKTVTMDHDESFAMDAWKQEIEALNSDYRVESL
ncbi:hypothetical protein A2706_01950 [Candidatus Peribacteria bacterium RIFCSPHIGHO2_01_FULL_51_35]|nr:MAG: hypothetical protein A2706_01950 [Candidatus Peribacteria bacterium RIFCSPHIGHO2_01_FULL_51_35]